MSAPCRSQKSLAEVTESTNALPENRRKTFPFRQNTLSSDTKRFSELPLQRSLSKGFFLGRKSNHFRQSTKKQLALHVIVHSAQLNIDTVSLKHGCYCDIKAPAHSSYLPRNLHKKLQMPNPSVFARKQTLGNREKACRTNIAHGYSGRFTWNEHFDIDVDDSATSLVKFDLRSSHMFFRSYSIGSCAIDVGENMAGTKRSYHLMHDRKVIGRMDISVHVIESRTSHQGSEQKVPESPFESILQQVIQERESAAKSSSKTTEANDASPISDPQESSRKASFEIFPVPIEQMPIQNSAACVSLPRAAGPLFSGADIFRCSANGQITSLRISNTSLKDSGSYHSAAELIAKFYSDILERESRNILMDDDEISDEEERRDLMTRNNILIDEDEDNYSFSFCSSKLSPTISIYNETNKI